MEYLFQTLNIQPKTSPCRYIACCKLSCKECTRKDEKPIYPKFTEYNKVMLLKILTYDDDYCVRLNNKFVTWSSLSLTLHDSNILGLACSIAKKLGPQSEITKRIKEFNWYGGTNDYIE